MNKYIKLAILSISIPIIMSGTAVSPGLALIQEAFPHTHENTIKMIVTLPTIILIPFSLITGKFTHLLKRRPIVTCGFILYILGGVGGAFSRSIHQLLFTRCLLGVGTGLLMPLSTSLIADFFNGGQRIHMMGYSNAFSNLGGIMASTLGGWLAMYHWRYIFLVYLIGVPILIFVLITLPEPPHGKKKKSRKQVVNWKVALLAIFGLFLNISFYSVVTNISFFIKDNHLGNSSSSGLAMSFLTLAGFLSSLFLQKFTNFFKGYKVSVGLFFMAMGFFLLSKSHFLALVYISTFLIGYGLGLLKPIILLKVTEIIPQNSNTFALSIVNSSFFLGKFLSPFVLDLIGKITYHQSISLQFYFLAISLLLCSVIYLFIGFLKRLIYKVKCS